ncbi:MAG: hypothetical protein Q8R13_02210 [bacterium]|nr:hypothetical protein [bacterium]MDZ4296030.1 hypothetical protein [Patescibacteria group bacterium]
MAGEPRAKRAGKRATDDALRGDVAERDRTLHRISRTPRLEQFLSRAGYTLATVPPEGVTVHLDNKVILRGGADIHEVTDSVHPRTRGLLEEINEKLGAALVGFDIITTDIRQPYDSGIPFGIIEANSLPYIDMHHFPVTGAPRNVAGAILDEVERRYCKE